MGSNPGSDVETLLLGKSGKSVPQFPNVYCGNGTSCTVLGRRGL